MKNHFLKKTAAGLLALLIVAGATPAAPFSKTFERTAITANAAEVASGNCGKSTNDGGEESVKWSLDDGGTLTISGKGDMADYTGAKPWGEYSAQIKTVVIEDGVTSIGNKSFYNYTLTSVTIPPSVKRIGDAAFYRCSNLTSFNIPDSVTTIGDYAFFSCMVLESLTIPASVTSIGERAFDVCVELKSISLKRATPPTLGEYAFYYSKEKNINTDLKIYVPVSSVDAYKEADNWSNYADTFTGQFYEVKLPDITGGTITADDCFRDKDAADKTVTLTVTPDTGYSVKTVKYNDGTDHIIEPVNGVYYFTMPAADVTVSAEFERVYTVTVSNLMKLYDGNTDVTGQQFPAGKTLTIEPYFAGVIRNVRANGELLTPDENGVYSVKVTDADIAVTADAYGKVSNFAKTAYVLWQIGEDGEPTDGVFTFYGTGAIGSSDLSGWLGIKTVVFDENCKVNEIDSYAFEDCSNLTAVTLGDSVETIGYNAFIDCSSLRSIDLGSGVTLIGTYGFGNAFYNCTSLDDVYISADPANLTWLDNDEDSEDAPDDFKPDGSTLIHVPDGYLFGYADKFSGKLNAKFVGEHDNIYGETAYEISVPHMTVTGLTDGKAKVGDTITLTPAKGCKVTEVKNGETELVPDESGAYSLRILTEPALTSDAAPIDYTITYDLNGGTNAATNPETYTVESEEITLADPTRTEYTFNGWVDAGGNTVSGIAKGSTGNQKLTATWTANEYSITYELDGGTNAATNPASYTIEDETIILADPTRTGYTFYAWFENGNREDIISTGSTGNKTFSALWKANSYKVTLPTNMMLDKTVLDAGKAKFDTEVSFKPMDGFVVIGAVSDGTNTLTATDGVYTFTMGAADVTISAVTGKFVPAVAPTCENDGNVAYYLGSDGKYYADTKGTVLESIIDPKIGHSYGAPSWTWASDFSSAQAAFTCGNCEDVQTVKAAITSEKTDATYEADGKIVYTATVTFGGKIYTDTKEVTIPKLVKTETEPTSESTPAQESSITPESSTVAESSTAQEASIAPESSTSETKTTTVAPESSITPESSIAQELEDIPKLPAETEAPVTTTETTTTTTEAAATTTTSATAAETTTEAVETTTKVEETTTEAEETTTKAEETTTKAEETTTEAEETTTEAEETTTEAEETTTEPAETTTSPEPMRPPVQPTKPVVPENAKTITATVDPEQKKVEIPIQIEDVAGDEWVSVKIDNGMNVALDGAAASVLAEMMENSGCKNITLDISLTPDPSKLTPETAAKVEEAMQNGAIVFDFNFVDPTTGKPLHFDTNNTGKVVVEIPVTPEQLSSFSTNIVVVYVDDNGNIEYMDTWYDPVTGKLTFATSHFSTYMVIEDDRPVDTSVQPDNWYASLEKFDEMAMKDYEDKHGNADVTAKSEVAADGSVQVTITDADGKVLDVYTIDPQTGNGTNQAAETVELPKTGNNNPFRAAATAVALGLTTLGSLALWKSGIFRKKDEE